MSVLTEADLLKDLDFKCTRCGADCSKINAAEPEKGYMSKVDGEFVGPLCDNCWNQITDEDKRLKKLPEAAFLVVIRSDGEGAYMTVEGISMNTLREPTLTEVATSCETVAKDIREALFAQKITGQILKVVGMMQNQPQSKLLMPKR